MPSRIVREGILTSARVNALSLGAETFYRRLMSVADDYGRYHASPATLRGACWPTCPEKVTEAQISGWLNECLATASQLLIRYKHGGAEYLQIIGFGQQTRTRSKFPEPSESETLINCEADAQPRARVTTTNNESRIANTNSDSHALFSICWDRHRKNRGTETRLQVARALAEVDWGVFDAKHRPFCEYWDRHGWNTCPVSMLEWFRNGMPLPPPEAVARSGPQREPSSERLARVMEERVRRTGKL